jgi:hypothetical protein
MEHEVLKMLVDHCGYYKVMLRGREDQWGMYHLPRKPLPRCRYSRNVVGVRTPGCRHV